MQSEALHREFRQGQQGRNRSRVGLNGGNCLRAGRRLRGILGTPHLLHNVPRTSSLMPNRPVPRAMAACSLWSKAASGAEIPSRSWKPFAAPWRATVHVRNFLAKTATLESLKMNQIRVCTKTWPRPCFHAPSQSKGEARIAANSLSPLVRSSPSTVKCGLCILEESRHGHC